MPTLHRSASALSDREISMHCYLNETSGSSVLLFLEASECNWLKSEEVRLVSFI